MFKMSDKTGKTKTSWTRRLTKQVGIWLGFITWSNEAMDQDQASAYEPSKSRLKEQMDARSKRGMNADKTVDEPAALKDSVDLVSDEESIRVNQTETIEQDESAVIDPTQKGPSPEANDLFETEKEEDKAS
jgi:hypothetical protein